MWYYNNEPFEEVGEYIGFVYLITNLIDNKKYVGKKNFYFSKSKQVKGKKKKFKVESDWRDYYGSSAEVQADVEKLGKENFKREILRLCMFKGEFAYYEAKYQFEYDVLLKPEEFYNNWISVRVRRAHLGKLIP